MGVSFLFFEAVLYRLVAEPNRGPAPSNEGKTTLSLGKEGNREGRGKDRTGLSQERVEAFGMFYTDSIAVSTPPKVRLLLA